MTENEKILPSLEYPFGAVVGRSTVNISDTLQWILSASVPSLTRLDWKVITPLIARMT